MNAQARLGAFVLLALLLLGFATGRVGDMVFFKQDSNLVETEFDDLLGLEVQSPVQMAGVKVGTVQEIFLRNGRAVVRIALDPDVKLPASTKASIVGRGLVGEKNLALRATPGDTELLPDGALIPSAPVGDINTFIAEASGITDDLSSLSRSLASLFGENGDKESLRSIIEKSNQAVNDLAAAVAENRSDLRKAVHNLELVTEALRKDLPFAMQNISKASKDLPSAVSSGKEFFNKGNQTLNSVDQIVLDNRENLYRMLFELRKAAEHFEEMTDDVRRNPWKLMTREAEVPPNPRAKQEKMEEMLMTTGQMGVAPAQH